MKKNIFLCIFPTLLLLLFSCNKKATPTLSKTSSKNKTDSVATRKVSTVAKEKIPTPQVIVVNDAAAKKTVDGRYYYDLNKKRYWRNKKDGKYYLFNKSMYSDPEFKP